MGKLAKWAQKRSPFLRIPDNSEVEVIYRGWKEVENSNKPGEMIIRYIVEIDGQQKYFESSASRVAMSFDTIFEGEKVIIERKVEGGRIRYYVKAPIVRENVLEDDESVDIVDVSDKMEKKKKVE